MVRNALDYLFERPHRQTQNQRRKRHDFNLTYFGPTTYDSGTPVVELDGSGSVSATNTFGANGLISRRVGSTSVFYTFDERGNTTQRLNSSGGVITSHISDAFGTTASSSSTTDPYDGYGAKFGYYTDHETGLILCTFRYYDPASGRWINRDPVGYGGGINLYGYARNNTTNLMDSTGYGPMLIDENPPGFEPHLPGDFPHGSFGPDGSYNPPDEQKPVGALFCPRTPDYYAVNAGAGWGIGWTGQAVIDRYGNLYAAPLGVYGGKSGASISLVGGWIDGKSTAPDPKFMKDFVSGWSGNVSAGYVLGAGQTGSIVDGYPEGGTEAGFYSPQYSVNGVYDFPRGQF